MASDTTAEGDNAGRVFVDCSCLYRASRNCLGTQNGERTIRIALGNESHEAAFIGHIKRIEAQKFTSAAHHIRQRN